MSELIRDAFTIVFARGFIRLSQLLTFLILARFLAPEEFGWFGLVTTAIVLAATVGSLGLRQSIAYQLGRGTLTAGEGTATILLAWPLLAGISSMVVFALYGRDLPQMSPGEAACVISVGVSSSMLLMMLQGIYLGRGDIRSFSASETAPRVLLAALILAVLGVSQASAEAAIWSYSIAFAIAAGAAYRWAQKDKSPLKPRPDRFGQLFGYGAAFSLNLFLITLCSRVSMFIIGHKFGPGHAGSFFAAIRINDMVLEAATAFGLVVFSRAVKDSDTGRVALRAARISCWVFWTFTLSAVCAAFLAPMVLRVMIGQQYADAGTALAILASGLGAASANKIIYPSIAGQGRPLFGTPVIALSLAVNLAIALWLVPLHGVNGGAIALVIGQYVMFTGYMITCRLRFGTPLRNFLIPARSDISRLSELICTRARRLIKK